MKRIAPILLLLSTLVGFACSRGGPLVDPTDLRARRLEEQALDFYQRIANRRFNSIATYQDPALREYFRSPEAWADYYASLVQVLSDAHFEASRPTRVRVEWIESSAGDEGAEPGAAKAIVRVRLTGANGQPLRWWSTSVTREDQWEREGERWWVVPGKV